MMHRRVKITGIGPVTPAGIGREEFWKGILEPVSRIRPFTKLSAEYGPFVAAYVDPLEVDRHVDKTLLPKGVARHTVFAVIGGVLAMQDAGISAAELAGLKCAVVTGSSVMDFGGIMSSIDGVQKRGIRAAQPRVLYTIGVGSVASALNSVLGLSARVFSVSTQCNSGMDAIGRAAEMVARGEVDLAFCGGSEAPLHRFPLLELRAAGLTPPTTELPARLARPFDLWRTTGVVSEGASMFVIEPESSPRPAYAFIDGYAVASDADESALCGGMVEAAKLALAEARMRTCEIDSINAWGPGHKLVDLGEVQAMLKVFGPDLEGIPAVSIKGAIGTPLGGAPAIQIASAALALHHGCIPPTVNWEYPDPACPLNLSNQPRDIAHGQTLINAHGLGGVNACMVLRRC
jgi:3-oxoacyl-[acyl-carrier-protein] synthase II